MTARIGRPLLRLHRPDAIQFGDLAGHALSFAKREPMPAPVTIARNTLRPRTSLNQWERALTNPAEARALLLKEIAARDDAFRRGAQHCAAIAELTASLRERTTWEENHAARLMAEDIGELARRRDERDHQSRSAQR